MRPKLVRLLRPSNCLKAHYCRNRRLQKHLIQWLFLTLLLHYLHNHLIPPLLSQTLTKHHPSHQHRAFLRPRLPVQLLHYLLCSQRFDALCDVDEVAEAEVFLDGEGVVQGDGVGRG